MRDATLAYVQHVRWALDLVAGAARPEDFPVAPDASADSLLLGGGTRPRDGARGGFLDALYTDEGGEA